MSSDLVWVIARSTGTASLVALTLSVLTGMALRSGTLAWLSHKRGIRATHDFVSVVWLPLGLAHVVALLFDRYAQVGLVDLVIPFGVRYGRLAIGLGTISLQLIVVVLISTWSRRSLTQAHWLAFHRLSYVAFAAAFAHGLLSGTDLANPVIAGLAWLVAALLALVGLRRLAHAHDASRLRSEGDALHPDDQRRAA